jgi:hypothetical protein
MKNFKAYLKEMNVAGDGGVFGGGDSFGHGGAVGNSDFYAPGTAVIPHVLGAYSRKGKVKSRRRKRKKKRN